MRTRRRFPVGALVVLLAGCAAHSHAPAPAGLPTGGDLDPDVAEALELAASHGSAQGPGSSHPNGWVGGEFDGPRIGPHDLLDIVVFDAPELSREVRVSARGDIALPLVGVVPAAGLTALELADSLENRLEDRYMRDAHVTVQLSETPNRQVYVFGEVNRPGALQMNHRDRLTVLQALAMGGGTARLAARSRAVIIRTEGAGVRTQIPVNLDRVVDGREGDVPMLPNDILFVPRSTTRSVAGSMWGAFTRLVTLRAIF